MPNEKIKHIETRNRIRKLLKEGFSDEEIAEKLGLKLGLSYIKQSVRWYKFCIVAKKLQKKAIKLHPNLYSRAGKIGGKRTHELHAKEQRLWTKKAGKIGGKQTARLYPKKLKEWGSNGGKIRMHNLKKNKEKFLKFQSTAGKKAHILHPDLALRMGKAGIKVVLKRLKEEGRFIEHQQKAGTYGGRASVEARRKNSPFIFMGCKFDSNQEREFCKLLVNYEIIKKPIENYNCHIKIGYKDFDFFPQQKIFIEYHPWDIKGLTTEEYYDKRREALNQNGYRNYPLLVIKNINEFSNRVLPIFKGDEI